MKQGKLFALLVCMLMPLALYADKVTETEALEKARKFMPGKNLSLASSRSLARGKQQSAGDAAFYIFNAEGKGGFVIVSGDDRTAPILGYSDTGELNTDNLPDNVRAWLEGYEAQAEQLAKSNVQPSTRATTRASKAAIAPLIKTQWNQYEPYNNMCPNGCVTGCVATALSQVMYYYKYPSSCPEIPAYTLNGTTYDALPATTFKWDLMAEHYITGYSAESGSAVSEIMRYTGQACQADYGTDATGAAIREDAMIKYFGYSKNMREIYRYFYYTEQWENIIYAELESRRPVLYSGTDAKRGGHQFICDGFDGQGLFHINWGWGGSCDGYFVLSLANDAEEGVDASQGTSGFAFGQSALIGFQPAKTDDAEIPQIGIGVGSFEGAEYTRSSADKDFESVSVAGFWLQPYYSYTPSTAFSFEGGWALCQNGQILKVLSTDTYDIDYTDKEPYNYFSYSAPGSVTFGAGIANGTYQLMNVFKPVGASEWQIPEEALTRNITALVNDNTLNLSLSSWQESYDVNAVTYVGSMGVGEEVRAVVNITNTGSTPTEQVRLWIETDGIWQQAGLEFGHVEPGQTGDVKIAFTPDKAGTFNVKITTDYEGNQVMGTSTLTIYATEEVTIDNITYRCNTGTLEAKVIGNTFETTDTQPVVIPESITSGRSTYKVTEIGPEAFIQCRAQAITIPGSVKKIGAYAMWNSWFTEIKIPEGVEEIGACAFMHCFLATTIELPSTLTSIGSQAFGGAMNRLEKVVANMKEPWSIATNAFMVQKEVDGETVLSMTTATLYVPKGTKALYAERWGWAPDNIVEMEGEATETAINFKDAKVKAICVANWDTNSDGELSEAEAAAVTTIGTKFKGNAEITLFEELQYFTGLTKLDAGAFQNCTKLETIVLPNGLQEIGDNGFTNCPSLQSLHIPASLTTIGEESVFHNCTSLTGFTVDAASTSFTAEDGVLYNKDKTELVCCPATKAGAFTVPSTVKVIRTSAFAMCAKLTSVKIPISVEDIRDAAFVGCSGLTAFDFTPKEGFDLVTVYTGVFTGCSSLTDFTVNGSKDGVIDIFDKVIDGVLYHKDTEDQLTSLVYYPAKHGSQYAVPEGVEGIESYAFCMTEISEVTLPASIESIWGNAFSYCGQLKKIVVNAVTPPFIPVGIDYVTGGEAFVGIDTDVCELYVPAASIDDYRSAAGWTGFKHIYGIGDASGNGKVDQDDVETIVNYIMGKAPAGFDWHRADANGDGKVDAADVVKVLDLIKQAAQ